MHYILNSLSQNFNGNERLRSPFLIFNIIATGINYERQEQ